LSREAKIVTGPALAPLLLVPLTLILAAVVTMKWHVLAAAAPPLITLAMALMMAGERSVQAHRSLDRDIVAEGENVRVDLRLSFDGPTLVAIEDDAPENMEIVRGSPRVLLGAAGSGELDYTIETRRGFWKFRGVKLTFRDPLGVYGREVFVELPSYLSVMPSLVYAGGLRPEAKGVRPLLGRVPSGSPGIGTEFYSLRDYLPTDPMRFINWKASARLVRLVSNEYEAEKAADLMLIVDSTLPTGIGEEETLLDVETRVAIALADEALRAGLRVGLASVGGPGVWVGPDWGTRQLVKLGRALAVLYPSGAASVAPVVAESLRMHIGPRCHVAVITPLLDPSWVEAVARLSSAGRKVTVISPSPYLFEERGEGGKPQKIALRILEIRRWLLLRRLKPYASVISWDPRTELGMVWRRMRIGA